MIFLAIFSHSHAMRIEIECRSGTLGEADTSRVWIFDTGKFGFVYVVTVHLLSDEAVDLFEEFFVCVLPVVKRSREG